MKTFCILSLVVLGLVPTILGTAAMADGAATGTPSASVEVGALPQLQAQTTPDTTLLRPL